MVVGDAGYRYTARLPSGRHTCPITGGPTPFGRLEGLLPLGMRNFSRRFLGSSSLLFQSLIGFMRVEYDFPIHVVYIADGDQSYQ